MRDEGARMDGGGGGGTRRRRAAPQITFARCCFLNSCERVRSRSSTSRISAARARPSHASRGRMERVAEQARAGWGGLAVRGWCNRIMHSSYAGGPHYGRVLIRANSHWCKSHTDLSHGCLLQPADRRRRSMRSGAWRPQVLQHSKKPGKTFSHLATTSRVGMQVDKECIHKSSVSCGDNSNKISCPYLLLVQEWL
jgi:hypothetical protein